MEGWIKLHRKLLDNCICKKPEYLSVWIYLLLMANHKETSFIWNNQKVIVGAGKLLTGRKAISDATGVREGTVENILKYLENEQQIEQQKTSRYRIITITKWGDYQNNEQVNEQRSDNGVTTELQQNDTYKNVKNEENDKNVKKKDYEYVREKFPDLFTVLISETEYLSLVQKFGEIKAKEKIEELHFYVGSKGKKYKSHYLTILNWERKNGKTELGTGKNKIGAASTNHSQYAGIGKSIDDI